MYLQASKSFLNYFNTRSDKDEQYATFYIKTYYDDMLLTERTFIANPNLPANQRLSTWTKVWYPPKGFAKVNRIVLSQGLEVDNIKFYMHLDVPLHIVRLDANDPTLQTLNSQGVTLLNKDDLEKFRKNSDMTDMNKQK